MPWPGRFAILKPMRLSSMMIIACGFSAVVAANIETCNCGPQIITYGDCPSLVGRHFDYEIQRVPQVIRRIKVEPPVIRGSYSYEIDGSMTEPNGCWSMGSQLPVNIERPIIIERPIEKKKRQEIFRGKTYDFGIDAVPTKPINRPRLGQYSYDVQKSVPRPKTPEPYVYRDPYRVRVYKPEIPEHRSIELPFEVERPIIHHDPAKPDMYQPIRRLMGLESSVDRIVIPRNCIFPEGPLRPCIDGRKL